MAGWRVAGLLVASLLISGLLGACTPRFTPAGVPVTTPHLATDAGPPAVIAVDGTHLPLRLWSSKHPGEPKAVILAVHGFNDYSNAFDDAGRYWAAHGITIYAYDQRGFGRAPDHGHWAGMATYTADLHAAAQLVRQRHPNVPVFILGESMGGAVAMVAATDGTPLPVNGLILVAPAVWSRTHMPFYQTGTLWLAAHTMPWLQLTGEGLDIVASDNIEMLRKFVADPLVIKATRVDAVWGLVDLMDAAFDVAPRLTTPSLILYGARDEIVPEDPTLDMMARLPTGHGHRALIYSRGYHMLLRDLQAGTVMADVLAWVEGAWVEGARKDAPAQPLPSGAEAEAARKLGQRKPAP